MGKKKRIFIDMDGVLCEYNTEADLSDLEKAGYFLHLKPCRKMVKAVRRLVELKKAEVFILSAVLPQCAERSREEKNRWLDRYLPEIGKDHRIFTLCGESKAEAVHGLKKSDVLCDDHSPNLLEWVSSGGSGVKILNGINGLSGTYTKGPRVKIEKNRDLARAVAAARLGRTA